MKQPFQHRLATVNHHLANRGMSVISLTSEESSPSLQAFISQLKALRFHRKIKQNVHIKAFFSLPKGEKVRRKEQQRRRSG